VTGGRNVAAVVGVSSSDGFLIAAVVGC